jgi:hypothetical protein
MSRPVLCDRYRCGRLIGHLAAAAVYLRFNRRSILIEAGVYHLACARSKAEPGRVEILPALDFMTSKEPAARLRSLARVPEGASVTRVLRKVRRLAELELALPPRALEAA